MKIAIIPARRGSKRIKNKNIKNFCGKPIISYSIETALNTKIFDKIIVSTDCEKISKISKSYGASVPFKRPPELSDDYTGIHEVLKDTVLKLKLNDNDLVCCIFATAPFINTDDIIKGFKKIISEKWEVVISAAKYNYPVYRSFMDNKEKGLKMLFPNYYKIRSQDIKDLYHDAGQFFWSSVSVLKNQSKKYNHKNSIIEIPSWRCQDIDTYEDWKRAEIIYDLINKVKF